jgi:hypothetical protein
MRIPRAAPGSPDQLRCHCIPAVCGETIGCFDKLRFGEAQIVNEKFCAIQPARINQTLEVRLPVPDVLIIDSVDHMLAQDVVRLINVPGDALNLRTMPAASDALRRSIHLLV